MGQQKAWETAMGMSGYVGSPMQSEDRKANLGALDLDNGLIFRWMRSTDGEISGFLEDEDKRIIKGTSGWYRTEDVWTAAQIAALKVG